MAGSINKCILIGNVVADPEIRNTNDGRSIANFRLATSESWRDKATGERKQKAEYHSIVVFNDNLVRVIEQYVKKGSKLYVEGQLQTRKYQAKDGSDRYSTEVVLQGFNSQIVLLDAPKGGSGDDSRPVGMYQGDHPAKGLADARKPSAADLDDDIPF
jgi:single-strand DNA-binding protein